MHKYLSFSIVFSICMLSFVVHQTTTVVQAQNSNQTSTNQMDPERLHEIITPHLSAISDAVLENNITKALDEARLVEAQLYLDSLNRTTVNATSSTNNTESLTFNDYLVVSGDLACLVDEWIDPYTLQPMEDWWC